MATLASFLVLTGASRTQEPPPPPQEQRLVDFVAAMVGTKAILASQVTEAWRKQLADDAQLSPEFRHYVSPAKRHTLWVQLLELAVAREITAQSARLMGKSPDEVEEQVQRIVREELEREAEKSGGLSAFARELGAMGSSMGSQADDLRADVLRSMAYYQGVLRELHDQRSMLATPREMRARFAADPARFAKPGTVKMAIQRFASDRDREGAARAALATTAAWRALPQPVSEEAIRQAARQDSEAGVDTSFAVVDVVGDEGAPVLRRFAALCKPGEVSDPVQDEAWVWVLLCLARTEGKEARFEDPEVQAQLKKEIADRRWDQIAARLFPEERVGVKRLPWGEPGAMERPRR